MMRSRSSCSTTASVSRHRQHALQAQKRSAIPGEMELGGVPDGEKADGAGLALCLCHRWAGQAEDGLAY